MKADKFALNQFKRCKSSVNQSSLVANNINWFFSGTSMEEVMVPSASYLLLPLIL